MCGITGAAWTHTSRRLSQTELDWMTDALAHRGPDGRGTFRKEYANGTGVALGHRRLAIIDAAGGQQPMANNDASVRVTFNGEIYNYRELRSSLEVRGHVFRTQSDTETILQAYQAYGESFVDHLRGMFAIGLWDEKLQKLILARDRLGEKPLVYCHENGRILFASEIKALQQIDGVGMDIRPEAIDQYLRFGYVPHPWTAFEGIEKLPPGYLGVYYHGVWRTRPYWQPDLQTDDSLSFEDASHRLHEALNDSVRLCMRSDVPMGVLFSGGMDSTIVAGLLQQHSSSPVQTFYMDFAGNDSADREHAQQSAKRLGFEHRQFLLDHDATDVVDRLVPHFDEPFADSSAIATYYLSQWTRNHVRVVMTGDGGDELFGGYARYQTCESLGTFDRLPSFLKRMLTGPWVNWIPEIHPEGAFGKLKHRLRILRQEPHDRYVHWVNMFSRYQRESLYHSDFLGANDFQESDQFLRDIMDRFATQHPAIRAMRTDMHSYLPCDILAKVDVTSMAHGLECRSPFMDHVLVEAVGRFPADAIYKKSLVKPLLGRTFASLIPPNIMHRRKIGFNLPLTSWLNPRFEAMVNDLLRNPNSRCGNYVRSDAMDRMIREHTSGYQNHGDRLWSLVVLESWLKHANHRASRSSRENPPSPDHAVATSLIN